MQLIVVTGLSGSGKSAVLHILEDNGYYCVDNPPATLIPSLILSLHQTQCEHVAISIDARTATTVPFATEPSPITSPKNNPLDTHSSVSKHDSPEDSNKQKEVMESNLSLVLELAKTLGLPQLEMRILFLDARDEVIATRFLETRRPHPLQKKGMPLEECIAQDRLLLDSLREHADFYIDTSDTSTRVLQKIALDYLTASKDRLCLNIISFGFKRGIPLDADLLFDVRFLPNPYYDTELRPLTGKDTPIINFFAQYPEVVTTLNELKDLLSHWIPRYQADNRRFLTIAIGCTGGQHRSVYLTESLANIFRENYPVLVRHRDVRH